MKPYYECHVTFLDPGYPPDDLAGWTFSRIDGDPNLGAGVKCYLTRHLPERIGLDEAIGQTHYAMGFLQAKHIEVLRCKVELVVYDTKQTKEI